MNIRAKLRHSISICPVSSINVYGKLVQGTKVNSVPCYLDGSTRRFIRDNNEVKNADFYCIIVSTLSVSMGSKVYDGTDNAGNVILPEGVVIEVTPLVHKTRGMVARELYIAAGQ
jgi:hypothetical protein